jgi:serine/threonine/tyrosine protein kinase RAD53
MQWPLQPYHLDEEPRLEQEINVLEKLNHPNVCRLCETFPQNKGGHGCCEIMFRAVLYRALMRLALLDLVLEYIEGGDLLEFILTHDGPSKCMTQHITSQMCSMLSVCPIPPSTLWALATLTLHTCSISIPKASDIATLNPRYAASVEFSPMDDSDNQFHSTEHASLTKDVPPIVKVADFGLTKAVNSLTMLRVCSLEGCLFALVAR